MRTHRRWTSILLVIAASLLLAVPAFAADGEAAASSMYGTFWALIPPVVAIVLALITKEAFSSLFIGILVGALFQCNFAPVATLDTIINNGFVAAIADSAGIFLFLVLLGIVVALINASGGSAAFAAGQRRTSRPGWAPFWPPSPWVF